jgi:hypothetical protein
MSRERWAFHVHALPDGRVLVIDDDQTAEQWDSATGEWHATAGLNNPRTGFASVLLADGRVLVAGGLNDMGQSYSSAYVFDPDTESWGKTAGLMITARTNPSAALLPDGRVLVAGGYFHVEPEYGASAGGNVLAAQRGTPGQLAEPDGWTDIVPGPFGAALATAEIFDPATGEWTSTGPMHYARNGAAMTTLADGRVLVAGSLDVAFTGVEVPQGAVNSTEVFDLDTGSFTLAGELPDLDLSGPERAGVNLGFATSSPGLLVPLLDGGAVLINRMTDFKHVGIATQSFQLDPLSGTWREIAPPFISVEDPSSGAEFTSPGTGRYGSAISQLADGRVLVVGGKTLLANGLGESLPSAETYDPQTGVWEPLPDMPEARSWARATLLSDGSVLVVGGSSSAGNVDTRLTSAVRLIFEP